RATQHFNCFASPARFGCRHWNSLTRPASACSAVVPAIAWGDKLLRQHLRPPGPRHAGDEARDAREHWADAVELAFHVNKIPISAAIEGRGAQEMVALVLRRRIRPDSRIAPSYRRKEGGGHVEQHEEQRTREG